MPEPRPKGADAHRQQGQSGGDNASPMPTTGGGDDEGEESGGVLPDFGVSNRTLFIVGVVAIALVFLYLKGGDIGGDSGGGGGGGGDDGDPFDAIEDEEEQKNVDEAGVEEPNITPNPEDPLQADEEAIQYLKGERGGGDDADVTNS